MASKKNWEVELTEESLLKEIEKARKAAEIADTTEPRAESVEYLQDENMVIIHLKNGALIGFPPSLAQGLENASPEQLTNFWVSASGRSIHWEDLDVDFDIAGLAAGVFGTKAWMSELGKRGGKKTSQAKASAAKENGKRGGRPKKEVCLTGS